MSPSHRLAAAVALTGLLAACSDGSAPTPGSQVRFNLASGPAGLALLTSDTFAVDPDTLVIDSVKLVLRSIKFQRVNEDACDIEDGDHTGDNTGTVSQTPGTASMHDDGGEDDGHDGHEDACESFNAGPYLLNLPLGPEVVKAFTVMVDTGTYDQVRFKIHKPDNDGADAKDAAFLAAHPDFNQVSIQVVGTFNKTPFTFTTDLDARERMALVPPLVVADSMQNVDVTIKVDVSKWFSNGAGGLVDPNTGLKGEANEDLVKDNIRNSFRAFRDDNRDGEDDDHEGHD